MLDFESLGRALIDAPCAWLSEPQIAAALGSSAGDLALVIDTLVAARLVERWDRPDGPVLTLSPLGAAQLGVRLVETPDAEIYRWSTESVSVRTRRISHAQRRRMDDHAAALAQVPDRRSAIEIGDRPRAPRRPPPPPRVLLWGAALWPWDEDRSGPRPEVRCRACQPQPRRRKGAASVVSSSCRCGLGRRQPRLKHCPACQGRPLPSTWYCLRCDRWGMDRGYFGRRLGPKTVRPQPRRKAG